jgi:hypothetical protein
MPRWLSDPIEGVQYLNPHGPCVGHHLRRNTSMQCRDESGECLVMARKSRWEGP